VHTGNEKHREIKRERLRSREIDLGREKYEDMERRRRRRRKREGTRGREERENGEAETGRNIAGT